MVLLIQKASLRIFFGLSMLISFCCCVHSQNGQYDSGIKSIQVSAVATQNLCVLGKVWGFLKYYHPVVARGSFDWDSVLFKTIPDIIKCKTASDRNQALSLLINKLGKIEENKNKKIDTVGVKVYPDTKWINDTLNLGSRLSFQLNQIKNAKRTGSNYYVSLAQGVGNPQFDNEKAYEKITNPDAGFRLLALYRYWNIINYFYPDKYLIGRNWDSILVEFIPRFLNDSNNLSYKLTALELIADIHDSHANIYGDSIVANYWGKYQAPVYVRFIENKLVVVGLININEKKNISLDTGDVILTINNKSVEDIVKEELPLTPASNYPTQLRNIGGKILGTNDTVIKLVYKRGETTNTAEIKCYPYKKLWQITKDRKKDTCFKYLKPDIAYLYPGSIKNDYLPKIAQNLINTKGLVIDLRCYPSDFIVYTFSRYLLPFSKNFVEFTNGSIVTPGLFSFTQPVVVGDDGTADYYKGKIIILVNETTQSQAEFTTMAFRIAPNAIVVGSTTAGADGNVSFFTLPGGIKTAISGIGVYYPDGRETQRVGIIPDIVLQPTIKGIQDKRDELLERAIDLINQY